MVLVDYWLASEYNYILNLAVLELLCLVVPNIYYSTKLLVELDSLETHFETVGLTH